MPSGIGKTARLRRGAVAGTRRILALRRWISGKSGLACATVPPSLSHRIGTDLSQTRCP